MDHATKQAAGRFVLVVEDETDLADLICFNLQREGYRCRCASGGDAALESIKESPPDLVILDRMLPGLSGDDVLAQLKRDPVTAGIPVVMLTAKSEESDQLVGFALGVDDYIPKPFSMKILLARVGARLRRSGSPPVEETILSGGPIRLNPSRVEVTVDEERIPLTATEFKILRALMSAGGRVLDRNRLLDIVFGQQVAVTDRTIDVHITALRRKLGAAGGWILTVRGVGYAFREPD